MLGFWALLTGVSGGPVVWSAALHVSPTLGQCQEEGDEGRSRVSGLANQLSSPISVAKARVLAQLTGTVIPP